MKLRIDGARIIDPANGVDKVDSLFVEDGVFADFIPDSEIEQSVDAKGMWLLPGLVDLRVNMCEPGQEHKATIESETRAAAAGGITTLSCPPDTTPVIDTPAMVHMIRDRAEEAAYVRVCPLGAMTVGLKSEQLTDMAALTDAGCAGISQGEASLENTLIMRRAMQYAATFDLTVFIQAMDPWLRGNGCVHEGEISTRLGLPAIPEAAETVAVARELALIETTGVRAHFHQLTSKRAVEMIAEARSRNLKVTADVSIHHLHLTEFDLSDFNTLCYVMPPLRGADDQYALRSAIANGVITAVCSDHQPHGADAKLAPISESAPGISGLETLFLLTLKLVHEGVIDLHTAIACLTINPAKILGLPAGTLSEGCQADFCLFNPDIEHVLSASQMLSRGHNTPFDEWLFKGKVQATFMHGKRTYSAN